MLPEPWNWTDAEGSANLRRELDEQGWSRFSAPGLLEVAKDPVELARALFGYRPLRYRRQEIKPDPNNPLRDGYWRSTRGARVHTDGPACGLPPTALVIMCQRPAADGGDVLLLDSWQVLRDLESAEPELYARLFDGQRRLKFADADHWGPTFSLRQGHFIGYHPPFDVEGDALGRRFRQWIERAEKVRFRPRAGDVYVVNNHRCLHGRLAFEDLGRAFLRVMYWFVEPFAAPAALVERAAEASARLGEELAGQPAWLRHRFGVDVPEVGPDALKRLSTALDLFLNPRNTAAAPATETRELSELQDLVLSACLRALEQAPPSWEERDGVTTRALRDLEAKDGKKPGA